MVVYGIMSTLGVAVKYWGRDSDLFTCVANHGTAG